MHRIAVVGGGISGLAAAFHLAKARRQGAVIEEHLFEASDRLGGVIRTERIDGCVVEAGPDSFLTEKPDAFLLAKELGIGEHVIGSNDEQRKTYILHNRKLVPFPEGLQFLVPARIWPVVRTPLLSLRDKWAIAREFFSRPPAQQTDESVASFVERHFGRGMVQSIVDPLLSGVYGGLANELSVESVLPRFREIERRDGSLVRGVWRNLRNRRKTQGARVPPLFSAFRDGLQELVDAIQARLAPECVACGRRLVALRRVGGKYQLTFAGGESFEADGVILALPAYESARLVRELGTALAERLAEIPYVSSLTVALGYERDALRNLPGGFGFLVPRKEGRRLLACTFVHNKFPFRVPADRGLLRCFLGGSGNETVMEASDEEVLGIVQQELEAILGLSAVPLFTRIYRWRKAMAQYTVGHKERLEGIDRELTKLPGLALAGNANQGIGIPDCIRSGKRAAETVLQFLRVRPPVS